MSRILLTSLFVLALLGAPAHAETPVKYEQVYLTEAQALAVALPGAERVVAKTVTPTADERKRIQRRLGRKLEEAGVTFHVGYKGAKPMGYALVMDEQGKYYPITFIVGLAPGGEVRDVAIMVYRERRGDAVKRRRFLDQFVGKSEDDAIMVNRDVTHLTGATVSSWSIAAGVKKAVVLLDVLGPKLR